MSATAEIPGYLSFLAVICIALYLATYLAHSPSDTGALARYGRLLARAADSPRDRDRAFKSF